MERVKLAEQGAAGQGMAKQDVVYLGAPHFAFAAEVLHPDGAREPVAVCPHNVVVTGGLLWAMNKAFGNNTNSTAGTHLFLHFATVGSGNQWNQISNSQVSGYGNNVPLISLASTYTQLTGTQSASYTFNHAGTQTVSGCGVHFYTTNTLSTNAATANVAMYCYGTFSNGSRAVQSNDTLNVTLTLSVGTA